ncbi:19764_t:CDS:2 [Funneliformis geosporum]|nr:19764_t:CDS:2 [Funneliformis geosporum]
MNIESKKSKTESKEENESLYEVNKIDAKIKALKIGLEMNFSRSSWYNKKRAIFEYLKLLDKNSSGKMKDQNYKVIPIKCKEFIEQNLLTKLGVSKKKTLDISTAVH